jgi:hypothetical protein
MSLREFNRHGLLSFVVLHGDHRGIGSASRGIALQAHAIVKFQRQSRAENGVLVSAKFQDRSLAKFGTRAERGGLHGNTEGSYARKEARQLFGAASFVFRK